MMSWGYLSPTGYQGLTTKVVQATVKIDKCFSSTAGDNFIDAPDYIHVSLWYAKWTTERASITATWDPVKDRWTVYSTYCFINGSGENETASGWEYVSTYDGLKNYSVDFEHTSDVEDMLEYKIKIVWPYEHDMSIDANNYFGRSIASQYVNLGAEIRQTDVSTE
jgi:hypothetical protein